MKIPISRLTVGYSVCLLPLMATAAAAEDSYAEDRAEIENLQARYMFALDFRDADAYASTFTEDGVLDYGAGEIVGRQAIHDFIDGMRRNEEAAALDDESGLRPAAGRHSITNLVLRIDGNRAYSRAYWFHMGNANPERSAELTSFGHYEDELIRVDGKWLFSHRKIYNEQVAAWAAKQKNPSW
jgi:ketosteroid isomerase-like protein